ncbi:hypothetical protein ACF0H5_002344 [Mactra antiquata]
MNYPNNPSLVTFHPRVAYKYGANGCHSNNTGSFVSNLSNDKWNCTSGCGGIVTLDNNGYYCIASSPSENWEQGEKRFTIDMSTYSDQITISYQSGHWLNLGYGPGGQWYVETKVDLRNRSDTSSPNNSPVTSSLPVYSIPQGCRSSLTIPVHDVDDDVTKCRWATVEECGEACNTTTSGLPGATLNPISCTLTIDATVTNGYGIGSYYLVAMTIEDFPTSTITLDGVVVQPTTPLSSVPLQFLLFIDNTASSCNDKPKFIDVPSDGANIIVPSGQTWSQRIYIEGSSSGTPASLTVSGTQGTTVTDLHPDDNGRHNVMYADITWTPTINMEGPNIICFEANDNTSTSSDQICYILLAGYPDPCGSNPCQNNGICNIDLTSYTCTCPSGVIGTHCEIDIDECLLSPCQNNGECYNIIGDYKCYCRQGYGGKNCTGADLCSANPCKGHGTCIQNDTSIHCVCYTGYTGPTCQIDVDDCLSSPCLNGAECSDLVGGYYCECLPPYTGQRCENETFYCDPNPCHNGGTCRPKFDGYVCDCPENVIGLTCEIPIQQVCDGDQSFCSCFVNGEPIHVTIPDPMIDDYYQKDLRTGVIGYPIGLLVGLGCCILFHYQIRRRCLKGRCSKAGNRPSSSLSKKSFISASSSSTVYPEKIAPMYPDCRHTTPPPRYSSLQKPPKIIV